MKSGFCKYFLSLLFFFLFASSISAQSFRYHVLSEPIDNAVEVEFTPVLPESATFVRWEINGEEFTTSPVTYTFNVSTTFNFDVNLFYTNPDLESVAATINLNTPIFRVEPDKELGLLASLKKVFRSNFNIEDNVVEAIGSWRFDWDVNGVKPLGITFSDGFGDYPNVYHTFENGGDHTINLRVTNVDVPVYTAVFSRTISLLPVFGTDMIDFEPIPNVFSPNGDGVNDNFEVIASGTTTLLFKVFSRTGALVFQHEGSVIKWDGRTSLGQEIPDGIYYYVLEDIGEKKYNPAKGFFYVLKGE